MLRPEKMRLVTIYGERSVLPRLVDVLHRLGRVQLEHAPSGEETFIRRPVSYTFFPVEGFLVELRAIKEYLRLTPPASPPLLTEGEVAISLPEQMETLSGLIRERREHIEALDAQINAAQSALQEIAPFIGIAAPLDLLKDNESLVFVAVRPAPNLRLPSGILFEEIPCHFGATPARVFAVERPRAAEFRQALASAGAQIMDLPGHACPSAPAQRQTQLLAQIEAAKAAQAHIRGELAVIAIRHAPFIFAAEEVLTSLVQKNGGVKRFASSEYAIAARFWAPEKDLIDVFSRIHESMPTGVEIVVEPETRVMDHGEDEHAPQEPTRLVNPSWARPFETLTELFDVPSAREVDPSLFMAICFPLFFGFMVGDAGYGGLMALAGWLLLRRCPRQAVEMAHLAYILALGGLAGALFGFFIFGDMFGIPLHPEEGAVFNWSMVLPASLLPTALLLKTEPVSVSEMLLFSALAGGLHMGAGCVFGILNEWPHSRRKAIGRLGQLLVIAGFTLMLAGLDGLCDTPAGLWLWSGPLAWINAIGQARFISSTLLAGFVLFAVGEGANALMEFLGAFGNVISFTRLALVGVSKAAVAIAVNAVILPSLAGSPLALKIILVAALVLCHFILILMAVLSCGIQAVRLHFCETFMKFFQGHGAKFTPFGLKRVYTRA